MVRNLLIGDNHFSVIHPFVSLSLLIASIVATFSLISSFCALRRKQPPNPNGNFEVETSSRNDTKPTEETVPIKSGPPTPRFVATEYDGADEVSPSFPLPPPPGKTLLSESTSMSNMGTLSSSTSQGKSFFCSISMKMSRVGTGSRQRSKVLDHEDSILKKKIILGEKCRIPDEDDAILLDDNGHRISTYHPRKPSSLPCSRQTSFIDPDAVHASISVRDDDN